MPTDDERKALSSYLQANNGDRSRLGETDKFMITMLTVSDCAERFRCLELQKDFSTAADSIRFKLRPIEKACDDVKQSNSLRIVLAAVLKLGNKLNFGATQVEAFTIDSLIKLRDAKVTIVFKNQYFRQQKNENQL